MALRFLLRQLQETRVKFCRALDIIPQMVQLRMMYTTEKMKTTWFPAQSRSKSTRLLCPANFHKGISTSDIAPGFLRQSMVFYFSFLDEFYLHVRLTAPIISTLLYVWLHTYLSFWECSLPTLKYFKANSTITKAPLFLEIYCDYTMILGCPRTLCMLTYPTLYTIQIVECMPVLRLGCLFFLFVLSFNSFVLMKRYTALRCCFRKQL